MVDRNNAHVASLCDYLHPAVLKVIQTAVQDAHRAGIQISVCGEMAGDPAATIPLIGMGLDSFSMDGTSIPGIKWVVRSFKQKQTTDILHKIMAMDEVAEIKNYLHCVLEDAGLGRLVRAGR